MHWIFQLFGSLNGGVDKTAAYAIYSSVYTNKALANK